jgi:hypothetical protein
VKVSEEAVRLQAAAADMMTRPHVCPFCGMMWDQEEAEKLLTIGDGAAYHEWLHETVALPVNERGPNLGQRGPAPWEE